MENNRSGVFWAVCAAYGLSIVSILTAFSGNLIGFLIALAVVLGWDESIEVTYAKKLLIKNGVLAAISILPLALLFMNAGALLQAPVSDFGFWDIARGGIVAIFSAISSLVVVIMMLVDLIKLWDSR